MLKLSQMRVMARKTPLLWWRATNIKGEIVTAKDNDTKVLDEQEKKEFEELTNSFYNNVYLNLKIK